MKFKHIYAFLACALAGVFTGCHSKVDLQNINSQAEVELGVALPVGSIRASIGDFLGGDDISMIYVDDDGIYHFIDTLDIPTKNYHKVDVSKYILENNKAMEFDVKPAVDDKSLIKAGEDYVITFDLKLSTDNFNTNPLDERIDQILVSNAGFTSVIGVKDFDLYWSEIKKVELVLGDQFDRAAGKTITLRAEFRAPYFSIALTNPEAGEKRRKQRRK